MSSGLNRLTLLLLSAALILGSFVAGCSHDCEAYAAEACEIAGEDSETCRQLRERASRVSAADLRACTLALELVEKFKKVR